MAYCEKCVHCTKIEKDSIEFDGRILSMWLCYCCLDGTWIELDDGSECQQYIEDKTLAL